MRRRRRRMMRMIKVCENWADRGEIRGDRRAALDTTQAR
jgi:hypothetical protein